ncbi:recQ-mediated genome instability protein 1-like [Tropilaelaps mercedesae]|uniref:RecQ-mediated genome instability protein 1 n=1 Tax=Tropilaelaps mercedesae TaxID=418985 RepID=A0A1V9XLJ5_9ACAR|nr:recQ-mediated genome instability protein 1-like [Tropilaelaps mercedesae]
MTSSVSALEAELTSRLCGLSCPVPRQWLREYATQHPLATGDECYQAPVKPRGVLQGCSLLQIVSIVDVGVSAYSQLCHLKGTTNANNEVSAEEPTNTKREPSVRGRRCLLLELSDGRCTIRAIEFDPMECLSIETPRGSKLLIRGPLEVRRSMILLREGHIELLGGSSTNGRSTGSQSRDTNDESMGSRNRELEEALQRQRVR